MKLLVAPAALVFLVGCMAERDYVPPDQNFDPNGGTNDIRLGDGQLRGDFGPRQGFDGPATSLTGNSNFQLSSSTVTASRDENGRGTGMVILWTNTVLIEQLEDGVHDFAYDETSFDETRIAANVCSGDDASNIDYDAPADRGTVVVTRNPDGTRLIELHTETAQLDDPSQIEVSDTSFVIGR